jgi:hypothetical protein
LMAENIQELVIEDEIFEEARNNFNRVLQRLFRNMIDSGSSDGSITLKIDVGLKREYIPNYDPDVEGESREIQKPNFDHKVSSTVTVKDELKGNKNPEMELIWDEDLQMYVLAYISNTSQRSIFDKDQPWNQDEAGQDVIENDPEKTWMNVPLLPGEAADEGALPGVVADEGALLGDTSNSEDVVIDEEYREIGNKSNVAGIDMEEDADDNGYDDYSYEEPDDPDSDDELRE